MPELPEVEVIRARLDELLSGRRIVSITVFERMVLASDIGLFSGVLLGLEVERVGRLGKCLQFCMRGGVRMFIHLRMTGQLFWDRPVHESDQHTHVLWTFSDETTSAESAEKTLMYRDVRKFGRIEIVLPEKHAKPGIITRRFGPDALEMTRKSFEYGLKNFRRGLKAALLDQQLVAGLGNIYVDEILFEAGLHPRADTAHLTSQQVDRLYDIMHAVLGRAIALGGSTLRDYVHTDGGAGSFQQYHQVYGRSGQPCLKCHSEIKTEKIAGRTSAYCPHCQPERIAA